MTFAGFSDDAKPFILDVNKITPIKNVFVSNDELMKLLSELNVNVDLSGDKDSSQIKLEEWLRAQRLLRQTSWDDNGLFVFDFPRNQNGPDKDFIDYYYCNKDDGKSDSIIFISSHWNCPKYKQLLVTTSQYPFLKIEDRYNYFGNNTNAQSSGFALKPFKWDANEEKYTIHAPISPLKDSSSLLVSSGSDFDVRFKIISSQRPSDIEKKIILAKLFSSNSNLSCLSNVSIDKIGTDSIASRFVGQLQFCQGYLNTWFIADIEHGICSVTLFEVNRGLYSSRFYCAYRIGANSLPDVYVWESESEIAPVKEIFYKSKKRWIVTVTKKEYTGNCFDKKE